MNRKWRESTYLMSPIEIHVPLLGDNEDFLYNLQLENSSGVKILTWFKRPQNRTIEVDNGIFQILPRAVMENGVLRERGKLKVDIWVQTRRRSVGDRESITIMLRRYKSQLTAMDVQCMEGLRAGVYYTIQFIFVLPVKGRAEIVEMKEEDESDQEIEEVEVEEDAALMIDSEILKPLACYLCKFTTGSAATIVSHVSAHGRSLSQDAKVLACTECDYSTVTPSSARCHFNKYSHRMALVDDPKSILRQIAISLDGDKSKLAESLKLILAQGQSPYLEDMDAVNGEKAAKKTKKSGKRKGSTEKKKNKVLPKGKTKDVFTDETEKSTEDQKSYRDRNTERVKKTAKETQISKEDRKSDRIKKSTKETQMSEDDKKSDRMKKSRKEKQSEGEKTKESIKSKKDRKNKKKKNKSSKSNGISGSSREPSKKSFLN